MPWTNTLFPTMLRNSENLDWVRITAGRRCVYILGYSTALPALYHIDSGKELATAINKHEGKAFAHNLLDKKNDSLPKPDVAFFNLPDEVKQRQKVRKRWNMPGGDQGKYFYEGKPLTLENNVKLLHAFRSMKMKYEPSKDGFIHKLRQLSLHPAVFKVDGFNFEYYKSNIRPIEKKPHKYFTNSDEDNKDTIGSVSEELDPNRRDLYNFLGLNSNADIHPLWEMSLGFPATYRTCIRLKEFCKIKKLPDLGDVILSPDPIRTQKEMKEIKENTRPPRSRYHKADFNVASEWHTT